MAVEPRAGGWIRILRSPIAAAAFAWTMASGVGALDPTAPYLIDRYTRDDGLPEAYVTSLLQSRDGYLWVGTQQGLARFDGVRFQPFRRRELPALGSSVISSLAEGADGTLWISTVYGGLTGLRGDASIAIGAAQGLPSNSVSKAVATATGLWVGTDAGAVSVELPWDPASGEPLRTRIVGTAAGLPTPLVWSFLEDPAGGVWIGTRGGGLVRLDGDRVTRPPGVGEAGERIRDLMPDFFHDGDGILIASERGLFRYAGGRVAPASPDLPQATVRAIRRSATGGLWVATVEGLFHVDRDGHASALREVGNPWIASILEDREGSLWLATFGPGLLRLRERRAVVYGEAEGLPAPRATTVIAGADGRLWVGTEDGLARRESDRFVPVPLPGVDSPWITALDLDGDRLRFATQAGQMGTVDAGGRVELRRIEGLPPVPIFALARGADGVDYLATNGAGVAAVRDGVVSFTTVAEGLPSDFVFAIAVGPDGRLWAGTEKGLARQEQPGGPLLALDAPELETGVSALLPDADGTLWLGTVDNGLFRLDDRGLVRLEAPGCYDDATVARIFDDGDGSLWVGSNGGLVRLPKAALQASGRAERCTWLGIYDGMRDLQVSGATAPGALRDEAGRLWFATAGGLVVVDPARWGPLAAAPPVHLESLAANGEAVAIPADDAGVPGPVVLGPGLERLEVGFTALSFLAPQRIRFRYRLEGFDRDWIDGRTARTAVYTNLRPGDYRLRVLAASRDGLWNEMGATLAIRVRPRFTETVAFYALLVVAVAALVAAAWALRVRHLRSRFAAILAERGRIARELHDTLAQGLHGVSLFLQAASAEIGSSGAAGSHLERAQSLVAQSLDETRRSIFELRSRHFEGRDLQGAIEARVLEQLEAAGIASRVVVTGRAASLPADLEADVLRLVEEAVHNALKHAAAASVEVTLAYRDDGLEVAVADDGRGIAEGGRREGSYGLVGMKERMHRWGGTLEVGPRPGGGTRVAAFLPRRETP